MGQWGVPGPVITVSESSLSVDVSAYKRPAAQSTIPDASDSIVTGALNHEVIVGSRIGKENSQQGAKTFRLYIRRFQ
jgi:hypothetical protein